MTEVPTRRSHELSKLGLCFIYDPEDKNHVTGLALPHKSMKEGRPELTFERACELADELFTDWNLREYSSYLLFRPA